MKPKYAYTDSSYFIDNLEFEYIETYSLQRGEPFDKKIELLESEFEKLETITELSKTEKNRLSELNDLLNFTQVIINKKGEFHFSSEKVNRFQKTDIETKRLIKILQTETKDIPNWMCAPIYRDAILFFDKNDVLIKQLNICVSCEYMETELFNHINCDFKTYELMSEFLIDIGHNIEAEEASD